MDRSSRSSAAPFLEDFVKTPPFCHCFRGTMPVSPRRVLLGLILSCLGVGLAHAQKPELVLQTGHSNMVEALAFSPDGSLLVSSADDQTVRIWDVQSSQELRTLIHDSGNSSDHKNKKNCLYLNAQENLSCWASANSDELLEYIDGSHPTTSPNEHLWVSGSWEGGVSVVNANNEQRSFDTERGVSAVALSLDGKLLASGFSSGAIKVWDLVKGGNPRMLTAHTDSVTALAVSRDGRFIATGSGVFQGFEETDSIKIWDVRSGSLVRTLSDNFTDVYNIVFSYDGKRLASGTRDSIKLWDLETSKAQTLGNASGVNDVLVFNQTGTTLINGVDSRLNGSIRTWAVPSGDRPNSVPVKGFGVLTISPDAKLVAAVSNSRKQGRPQIRIAKVSPSRTESFLNLGKSFTGNDGAIFATFSSDAKKVAVVFSSGKLGVWESATGRLVHKLKGEAPAAISPNGRFLATAQGNDIAVYDIATGLPYRTLKGHANRVVSLSFYGSNGILLSGSLDSTTRVWDVTTDTQLASLIAIDNGDWLVVTPDGLFDGTADAMRQVSWRVGTTIEIVPLDAFFNDFFHPGLLTEVIEGSRPKASIDIATVLQLPSLRTMLSAGLAHIDPRDESVLCFSERPTARPQVYVDGQLLDTVPNEEYNPDDPACRYRVKLPANSQYEITNTRGGPNTQADKPVYDGTKSETTKSTLHILTVGVGKYDFSTSGLKPLPASATGAKEIEDFFATQKSSINKAYRHIRIWDGLYDSNATREAIRQRLADMAKEVKEDDVVFLFFSGHGIVPAGQEMFYFAPINMRGPNPREQRETGLNTAMLAEAIREMPARRIVLIIDACQSGGAIESLAKIADVKAKGERQRDQIENLQQPDKREHQVGVYVIAAATPLQLALQPTTGNGALVLILLEALKTPEASTESAVWVRELIRHIEQRLPVVSAQIGPGVTPMIVSTGVDFPVAHK